VLPVTNCKKCYPEAAGTYNIEVQELLEEFLRTIKGRSDG
jgi:hypothetical protein